MGTGTDVMAIVVAPLMTGGVALPPPLLMTGGVTLPPPLLMAGVAPLFLGGAALLTAGLPPPPVLAAGLPPVLAAPPPGCIVLVSELQAVMASKSPKLLIEILRIS
jgi:hypothetical protein